MTLNITSVSDAAIIQVSDRRMVSADWRFVDDHRNKAILLRCQNGLLAITFAGLGMVNGVRMDTHVAGRLQDEGIAELNVDDAIPSIAAAGVDILRNVSPQQRHHAFTVAGFAMSTEGLLAPKLWILKNYKGIAPEPASPAADAFTAQELPTPNAVMTGLLGAFTAEDKVRLEAVATEVNDKSEELDLPTVINTFESGFVDAIRRAASRTTGIGRSCMALSLTPSGEARATSYPDGDTPHSYAPNFVWYAGGRNICIGDVDALVGGDYAIEIGGDDGPFRLGVGVTGSERRTQLPPDDFTLGFQCRFTAAVHHPGVTVQDVTLARIPSTH